MTLSEEARERLADIVDSSRRKTASYRSAGTSTAGARSTDLEAELKEYYYRNDNSLIRATPEATTLIDGEDSERIQTVTSPRSSRLSST